MRERKRRERARERKRKKKTRRRYGVHKQIGTSHVRHHPFRIRALFLHAEHPHTRTYTHTNVHTEHTHTHTYTHTNVHREHPHTHTYTHTRTHRAPTHAHVHAQTFERHHITCTVPPMQATEQAAPYCPTYLSVPNHNTPNICCAFAPTTIIMGLFTFP